MKTQISLCILMAVLGSGCAKDRTLDDFKREQTQKDLGKLQTVDGEYGGQVLSASDHSVLGDLKFVLSAKTQVSTAPGVLKADEQPVLVGTLTFTNQQTLVAVAKDSYYDPTTGKFQANIPIQRASGKTDQLTLSGNIQGDSFNGTIEAIGQSDFGGTFSLTRGAATQAGALTSQKTPQSAEAIDAAISLRQKSFIGTTEFKTGETLPVSFVVLDPKLSSEEEFLSLFYPVKSVEVNLNYGDSIVISHASAQWDKRVGTLTGQAVLLRDGEKVNILLECRQGQSVTDITKTDPAWTCQHVSGALGWVATTKVVAAINNETAPNSGLDLASRDETFVGQLNFTNGESRSADFRILYPRKDQQSTLAELFFPNANQAVSASFTLNGSYPILLESVHYNRDAGTLSGSYSMMVGQTANATLSQKIALNVDCKRDQSATTPSWYCKHFTSKGGSIAEGQFVPSASASGGATRASSGTPIALAKIQSFEGKAVLPGGVNVLATLKATLLPRTRAEDIAELFYPPSERNLQVSITLSNMSRKPVEIRMAFDPARWDRETQVLTGTGQIISGGEQFALQVQCVGFPFEQTFVPFECTYRSNHVAQEVSIKFERKLED